MRTIPQHCQEHTLNHVLTCHIPVSFKSDGDSTTAQGSLFQVSWQYPEVEMPLGFLEQPIPTPQTQVAGRDEAQGMMLFKFSCQVLLTFGGLCSG